MNIKALLMTILLLVGSSVCAQLHPYVSIGYSHADVAANGNWYQKGLPGGYRINVPSFGAGVQRGSWRVGGIYFGRYSSECDCTPTDANYDPKAARCIGPCEDLSHFSGHGQIWGLTSDYTLRYNGFLLSPGIALLRRDWVVHVKDWHPPGFNQPKSNISVMSDHNWRPSPSLGIGYEYGKISVRATAWINVHGTRFPGIYNGNLYQMSLTYTH